MIAVSKGMKISFFESMIRKGIRPVLLFPQYDCNDELNSLVDKYFYNNQIDNETIKKKIVDFTCNNNND